MTVLRIEASDTCYSEKNQHQLTVYTDSLERRADISVYAEASTRKDVPLVLLLHGVYGSDWVWMRKGGAHEVYKRLRAQGLNEFVLVMPSDGGLWEGSGYLPLPDVGNYEKWIAQDVPEAVRAVIPQASQSSTIYIAGLSMGGYGALRLGALYPDVFRAISGHSSVTSMQDLQQFVEYDVARYQHNQETIYNLQSLLEKQRDNLPPLRFDCGREDSLFESNEMLHKHLTTLGIKHEYQAFEGSHAWEYWHEHLEDTLWFFNKIEKG